MKKLTRNDVHSPSNIQPEDYTYFASGYSGGDPFIAMMYVAERERIQKYLNDDNPSHKFSGHDHGGVCHICGCVNITWTHYYTHAPSGGNLIVVGEDCAMKLDLCSAKMFRHWKEQHKDALELARGKGKAKAYLEEIELVEAWDIYEADWDSLPHVIHRRKKTEEEGGGYVDVDHGLYKEESTVRDIVGRLVKWGSVSEKQENYLRQLVKDFIPNRGKREAQAKRKATIERKRSDFVGEIGERIKKADLIVERVITGTNSWDEPWKLVVLRDDRKRVLKYWGWTISAEEGEKVTMSFTVKRHEEGTSKHDLGVKQTLIQRPYIYS